MVYSFGPSNDPYQKCYFHDDPAEFTFMVGLPRNSIGFCRRCAAALRREIVRNSKTVKLEISEVCARDIAERMGEKQNEGRG